MDYYDNNNYDNKDTSQDMIPNHTADTEHGNNVNQPNRMAVIAMLCGIAGTLFLCCCVAFPASILCGVAAISLSLLSRKGQPFCGYAIAGLVLGIVSLLLGLGECAYLLAVSSLIRDPEFAPIFDEVMSQYQALLQQSQ